MWLHHIRKLASGFFFFFFFFYHCCGCFSKHETSQWYQNPSAVEGDVKMRVRGFICLTSQLCFINSHLIKKKKKTTTCKAFQNLVWVVTKNKAAFLTLVLKFKKCIIHESQTDKTHIQSIGSETFKDICFLVTKRLIPSFSSLWTFHFIKSMEMSFMFL